MISTLSGAQIQIFSQIHLSESIPTKLERSVYGNQLTSTEEEKLKLYCRGHAMTRLRLCATLVENYYHLATIFADLPSLRKNQLPEVLGGPKFEEILPKPRGIHPEIFSFLTLLKN